MATLGTSGSTEEETSAQVASTAGTTFRRRGSRPPGSGSAGSPGSRPSLTARVLGARVTAPTTVAAHSFATCGATRCRGGRRVLGRPVVYTTRRLVQEPGRCNGRNAACLARDRRVVRVADRHVVLGERGAPAVHQTAFDMSGSSTKNCARTFTRVCKSEERPHLVHSDADGDREPCAVACAHRLSANRSRRADADPARSAAIAVSVVVVHGVAT